MTVFVFRLPLVLFIVASASLSTASAQKVDKLRLNYLSGRNQLGILMYCSEKGHIDDTAVVVQKKLIARMWKPTDLTGGEEAEAAGRNARITNLADIDTDIGAVSKAQGVSERAYCEDLSSTVKEYRYLVR